MEPKIYRQSTKKQIEFNDVLINSLTSFWIEFWPEMIPKGLQKWTEIRLKIDLKADSRNIEISLPVRTGSSKMRLRRTRNPLKFDKNQ